MAPSIFSAVRLVAFPAIFAAGTFLFLQKINDPSATATAAVAFFGFLNLQFLIKKFKKLESKFELKMK